MMNRWLKTCWRETLICLLLAAAVWGVFGQTVRFGFVNYDDAAYAEAGRFDEAVTTAGRAVELARAAGDEPQAQKIETRLQLYRRGLPFRE